MLNRTLTRPRVGATQSVATTIIDNGFELSCGGPWRNWGEALFIAIVGGAIDKGYKLSCDDPDRRSLQLVHRGIRSQHRRRSVSDCG